MSSGHPRKSTLIPESLKEHQIPKNIEKSNAGGKMNQSLRSTQSKATARSQFLKTQTSTLSKLSQQKIQVQQASKKEPESDFSKHLVTTLSEKLEKMKELSFQVKKRISRTGQKLEIEMKNIEKLVLRVWKDDLVSYCQSQSVVATSVQELIDDLNACEEFVTRKIIKSSVAVKARYNNKLKHYIHRLHSTAWTLGLAMGYLKSTLAIESIKKLGLMSGYPTFDLLDLSDQRKLAAQGDSYYFGHGVSQNLQAAYRLYLSAAKIGDARCQFLVAKMSFEGIGVDEHDPAVEETGVDMLMRSCDQQYPDAFNYIGKLHDTGNTRLPKDPKLAVKFYYKAAQKHHLEGMYNLAHKLLSGDGIKKDENQAVVWLRKAAHGGYVRAQNQLGHLYYCGIGVERDYGRAVELFREAADQNDACALNNLGIAYEEGSGVVKDYTQAGHFYEKSAALGNQHAVNNLGYVKLLQNRYQEARQHFIEASDKGSIDALYNLGMVYDEGLGCAPDIQKAYNYYLKASQSNHPKAQKRLGDLLYSGIENIIPQNYQEAASYYKKSAIQGNADAANALGVMKEDGIGIQRNEKEAFKYYEMAVKLSNYSHPDSLYNLASMFDRGFVGFERNPQRAKELYEKAAARGKELANERLIQLKVDERKQLHNNENVNI